jgi:DNA-binding GntR family transcriptional regulator
MAKQEQRDPYGAALGAVRSLANSGRFIPGEPLVVTELAAEVGFSPTPVREALACLAGEGVIERRRGRGYFYPDLTPSEVMDLFELQLTYVHSALTLHPRGLTSLRKAVSRTDPLDGMQALFEAIIAQSTNAALILAHQRLTERLGAILRAERRNEGSTGSEVRGMVAAVLEGRMSELLERLQAWHEDRCARVHRLAGSRA